MPESGPNLEAGMTRLTLTTTLILLHYLDLNSIKLTVRE